MNGEKKKNQRVREMSEIETIEDLEACYPGLVSEVRDGMVRAIEAWPTKQVREQLPELYQRIAAIGPAKKSGSNLNVPGFLLEEFILGEKGREDKNVGDPFAPGTLRTFMRLKQVAGLELPFVLPFSDPFTRPAIEYYILISAGGYDKEGRADKARKALQKCV